MQLLGLGRTAEAQYVLLLRARLLSPQALADRAAVVAILEDLRREAQAERLELPAEERRQAIGSEPPSFWLPLRQAHVLDEAGYLDRAARDAFDQDRSPRIIEELRTEDNARRSSSRRVLENGLACGFCWARDLPRYALYCGHCGYRLQVPPFPCSANS